MRNVFGASVNEKSTIECSDFLISILKSPTPQSFVYFGGGTLIALEFIEDLEIVIALLSKI